MDQFATILAGHAVAVAALEDGQEVSEIEIIPSGVFALGDGRGTFTVTDPQALIDASLAHAAARGDVAEILIDFDHGSERKGHMANSVAAGWITGLRHDAARSRIMATVRWTRAGREALADRAYRFISPVFAHDKQNRVRGILRAGLTNTPAIGELKALAASTKGDGSMEELLQKLAAALGLEAGAGEDKITAAALDLIETGKNAGVVLAAAGIEGGLSPDEAEALAGKITAAASTGGAPDPAKFVPKGAYDELSTKVAALEADRVDRAALDLVAAADAEGKITPANRDWALSLAKSDPEAFDGWRTLAAAQKPAPDLLAGRKPGAAGALAEHEKAVCASMGISEEDFIAQRDGKKPAKKED
jgi:phage I-like protein